MTEWAVFGVVVSIFSFFMLVAKPLISLTKAITKLTVAVEHLQSDSNEQREKAKESHEKLWKHNAIQDERIDKTEKELIRHDDRLRTLENNKGV